METSFVTNIGNQLNCKVMKPRPKENIFQTPASKAEETLWKMGLKDCKSQKIWKFPARLWLLVLLEATPINITNMTT